jgi:MYXO-CTERM domain-containing protein
MQSHRWAGAVLGSMAVAMACATEQLEAQPPAASERRAAEPAAGPSTPAAHWSENAATPERAGALLLLAAVALLVVRARRNRD